MQKANYVLSIDLSKSSWIFENVASKNCSHLNKKGQKHKFLASGKTRKSHQRRKMRGKMERVQKGKERRKEKKVVGPF